VNGNIFNSRGIRVGVVKDNAVFGLKGHKLLIGFISEAMGSERPPIAFCLLAGDHAAKQKFSTMPERISIVSSTPNEDTLFTVPNGDQVIRRQLTKPIDPNARARTDNRLSHPFIRGRGRAKASTSKIKGGLSEVVKSYPGVLPEIF
jgi:hypothetical protein